MRMTVSSMCLPTEHLRPADGAAASVLVPHSGSCAVLARFEMPYRFEVPFKMTITQAGATKFTRVFGRRSSLKIWGFSAGRARGSLCGPYLQSECVRVQCLPLASHTGPCCCCCCYLLGGQRVSAVHCVLCTALRAATAGLTRKPGTPAHCPQVWPWGATEKPGPWCGRARSRARTCRSRPGLPRSA